MRTRTHFRVLLVAALTLAFLPMLSTFAPGGQVAGFTTASPAVADQIWYQSVGRAGTTAACQASTATDLAVGWTDWAPSWAKWVNGGNGGFVCNRQITWAFDSVPPSSSGSGTTPIPTPTPAPAPEPGPAPPAAQSITFPTLANTAVNAPPPIPGASASSSLTVSYASATTPVCTVTTVGVITLVATGTCTINASQGGNSTFAAASPVSQSFTVNVAVYAIGDTGPGGGLVFLISGGRTYEMAPKTWGVASTDTGQAWTTNAAKCYAAGSIAASSGCFFNNLYPETTAGAQAASTTDSLLVGMGAANTDAIIARMNALTPTPVTTTDYAAGLARGYTPVVSGVTINDWFLPSQDELNAMCNYSRNPTIPPTGNCTGTQDDTFATGAFGFAVDGPYWSSSQSVDSTSLAWDQVFGDGTQSGNNKFVSNRVRPVRAF